MQDQEHNNRLLVITELYLPTKGGTAVWFDEVYRRLGGGGIHIVTADVPEAAQHDRGHPNTIHRVSLRRRWWLRPESLAMYIRLLVVATGLALRNRFDAVHAGRVLPEGLVAWLTARLIRRPVVIYAHGEEITTWRQPAKFRVMSFVYRHADKVIANSEFTRQELVKLGVAEPRILLIHPGVDVERFRPGLPVADLQAGIGLSSGQKLILSVGRLSRRKGFDQVIRSLPLIREQGIDARYVIVGIGEDQGYLEATAVEEDVADRVHLIGHVPMEDLPRWYNAADVFAMPNRDIAGDTEGFGMVFTEAAACETPVVAGIAGGTGSAVIHGETGLRVEGANLEEVAAALVGILADDARARQMGIDGCDRVRREMSWEMVAGATEKITF